MTSLPRQTARQAPRLLLLFIIACSLLHVTPSRACMNVTMEDDESIAKLKEAERALDEGDVMTARRLAYEVKSAHDAYDPGTEGRYFARALRIEALSLVRDPTASPKELEDAAESLERHIDKRASDVAPSARPATIEPALAADFGEALERNGRDAQAIAHLAPLADRDLIGSPYAYAALSRAAGRQGDAGRSAMARARCEAMAGNPRICSGEYPRPPLLRGRPLDYAASGAVFALAALLRIMRGRRKTAAPWMICRAPRHTAISGVLVLLAGVVSFGWANERFRLTGAVFAAVLFLIATLLERRLFFSAVRRGEIAGFHLRAAEPVDEGVPILRLIGGPSATQTLERLELPSYRESARAPVLRIGAKPLRRLVLLGLGLGVLLIFAGCATLTLRTRKSEPVPARIHEPPSSSSMM